jgi:aspartate aminotransferase
MDPAGPANQRQRARLRAGHKPLLFALLLALGADVAVPKPSWVSYAAQVTLAGARPHFVPTSLGEGGICEPSALARAVTAAGAAGRPGGSVIVTLPDNPTGQLAQPPPYERYEVAARHDLVIISDEIYRDLVYDTAPPFLSPAACVPERTVVTTAPSKNLACGGVRVGAEHIEQHRVARQGRRVSHDLSMIPERPRRAGVVTSLTIPHRPGQ